MKVKNGIKFALGVLFWVMFLGAKGCEVSSKADILEAMPEILEIAPDLTIDSSKFDIRKYGGVIALTTYDNLSFLEAINKLKNETPMNIPIRISMFFYGEYIGSEGEFKTEQPANDAMVTVFIHGWTSTGIKVRPYTGIIHIRDGWWTASEFDAASLFTNGKDYPISLLQVDENNDDDKVLVTEYAYANETVYKLNGFSSRSGILSLFDKSRRGGSIQGDGSMPDDIISVFDKR